jgi:hypothetical protein
MFVARLRHPLVAIAALVVGLGCTTSPPTGPEQPAAPQWRVGGGVGKAPGVLSDLLLECTPLAAERVAKQIGPEGGTVQVGPHLLEIPAGALTRKTRISAEIVPDSTSSVKFGPSGLVFATPARLTLSYAHCQGAANSLVNRRIAYTTDALQVLKLLPTADVKEKKAVAAPLDHFSRYAVAW